jgi:hypothetical protein
MDACYALTQAVGIISTFGRIQHNNGYQESLKMSMFEVFYGKKCRVLISWENPVDQITLGPELLKEMEYAIVKIR